MVRGLQGEGGGDLQVYRTYVQQSMDVRMYIDECGRRRETIEHKREHVTMCVCLSLSLYPCVVRESACLPLPLQCSRLLVSLYVRHSPLGGQAMSE